MLLEQPSKKVCDHIYFIKMFKACNELTPAESRKMKAFLIAKI
jgi:hypothetical protein